MTIELLANSKDKPNTMVIIDGQEIDLKGVCRIKAELSCLADEPFIKVITEQVGKRTEVYSG